MGLHLTHLPLSTINCIDRIDRCKEIRKPYVHKTLDKELYDTFNSISPHFFHLLKTFFQALLRVIIKRMPFKALTPMLTDTSIFVGDTYTFVPSTCLKNPTLVRTKTDYFIVFYLFLFYS